MLSDPERALRAHKHALYGYGSAVSKKYGSMGRPSLRAYMTSNGKRV